MRPTLRYAELHVRSCFSFLEGAATPEDLVARAAELGLHALALSDRDGVYGVPRFHAACREAGVRGVVGSEISLHGGTRAVLLVETEEGWRNLCRLLSLGRRASAKGLSAVSFEQLAAHARGLIALSGGGDLGVGEAGRFEDGRPVPCGEAEAALLRGDREAAAAAAARWREVFGKNRFFLELHHHLLGREARLRGMQEELARRLDLRCVATNVVHYCRPVGRRLQDVLCCIREKTSLERAGRRLLPNGEFWMKEPAAMQALFREHPRAFRNTVEVADRCRFRPDVLRHRLPEFAVPEGETLFSFLHRLANEGARRRYRPLTPKVARQLAHELDVIDRLGFAGYFLIVWDVVRFCQQRGILCQGRGSAANSVVCYALAITSVDPVGLDLLFERFLSEERSEPPDIDLDIEHERREEVLQYVYEKYGREHAGMVCTFITYHARSAVRDVGKALGLSEDQVRRANKTLDFRGARELAAKLKEGKGMPRLGLGDLRMRLLADLCWRIDGFPRHLSIHTGGMVIAAGPLHEVVPVENATMPGRTVIQWDKDDVAAMGLVKIDLLGLGGLTLVHRAQELLREKGVDFDMARMDAEDPKVYDMCCAADTVGVFQIESRAQMNTLPRLRPRKFYDLVVEVALIRPGPIQGGMVHPYLRRRQGKEAVSYPHPSLKPILERTLGVPLFQEQGMKIAVTAAGFTPSEADELRRAMGHRRSHERMQAVARRLMDGMARNGIGKSFAERIFLQLAAFADYGFPESHSASFALIVYATAWIKCHHPDVFLAAILNAQPMGFYSTATLVHDARRHGVEVRPIDVRSSAWDCTLEELEGEGGAAEQASRRAVRIGLRFVHGLGEEAREGIERARRDGPFRSAEDFGRRCGLSLRVLETLARVGAFAGFGAGRRDALWQIQRAGREVAGPLAEHHRPEEAVSLLAMSPAERLSEDYQGAGVSAHQPMELWRPSLKTRGVLCARDLDSRPAKARVTTAGLVICRQKPPTAKGFCFVTLEDETGMVNVVFKPRVYERHRRVVRLSPFLLVQGRLEKVEGVLNLVAERCEELRSGVELGAVSHDYH